MPLKFHKTTIVQQVGLMPGAHIAPTCRDLLALSKRLNIGITADFNGVLLIAFPHLTAKGIQETFKRQMAHLNRREAEAFKALRAEDMDTIRARRCAKADQIRNRS